MESFAFSFSLSIHLNLCILVTTTSTTSTTLQIQPISAFIVNSTPVLSTYPHTLASSVGIYVHISACLICINPKISVCCGFALVALSILILRLKIFFELKFNCQFIFSFSVRLCVAHWCHFSICLRQNTIHVINSLHKTIWITFWHTYICGSVWPSLVKYRICSQFFLHSFILKRKKHELNIRFWYVKFTQPVCNSFPMGKNHTQSYQRNVKTKIKKVKTK